MSKKDEVLRFAAEVKSRTSCVDILVNNVGTFIPGKITEEEDGVFELLINTNLASTYHLTRSLVQSLKQSNRPYIFNICSTASFIPYTNGGSYCISKFGQLGLTKVLREELREDEVKVSAIMPGATYTDSWIGSELPPERFINPSTIASHLWTAYTVSDNSVVEDMIIRPVEGDL